MDLQTKSCGRKKSRLVACGYSQRFGEDFTETFAPVLTKSSFRFLLALSQKLSWELFHWDVETAFLNAELKETIFMEPPKGFQCPPRMVYKLKKSLYGPTLEPAEYSRFRSLIGVLLYIATCTRPDICFCINMLARRQSNPSRKHLEGAERILVYLLGHTLGIKYGRTTAEVSV